MPIPTHDLSCITKAFPTRCPDCKMAVFFFSCNCGSKVYFDDLGDPWPKHYCNKRNIRELLELMQDLERRSDDEIYKIITRFSKERGYEIPDDIYEIIDSVLANRTNKIFIIELNDLSGIEDISGQVTDLTHHASFKSKFKIDLKNPMHKGLAGALLRNDYAEITIREKPDRENSCRQFKVYAKEPYLKKDPIKKGDFLLANIEEIPHGFKRRVWEIMLHKVY